MARLLTDGFDWPTAATNLTQRWISQSNVAIASASSAHGTGQYLTTSTFPNCRRSLGSNEATIFGSFRIRRTSASTAGLLQFVFQDNTNNQCAIQFDWEGNIIARNTSTVFATVSGCMWNVWESYQFRVVINNTTGSMEIRKNGSSTPIINVTNVNTRAGSSNAFANVFQIFNSPNTSISWHIDDLFLWSDNGAAPTSWLGDVRVFTKSASGNGNSTQFTLATATTEFGEIANLSTTSQAANVIRFHPVVSSYNGEVVQANIRINAGITGTMNVAVYSANGRLGQPGTKIGESTPQVNPTAGTKNFSLVSAAPVIRGATYWIGIHSSATVTLNTSLTGSTFGYTFPFGTFPNDVSRALMSPASSAVPYGSLIINHTNASANSDVYDNDTTFVQSNTVGHVDLYNLTNLPSTPTVIVGAEPFIQARRQDSGARTVGTRIRSGTTEVTIASTASAGTTSNGHAFVSAFQSVDPNTSGTWTQSSINALQVGPEVVA